MLQRTKLSEVQDDYEDPLETDFLDEDNLPKAIVDLSLSLDTRILAINLYYKKEENNVIELLNKLGTMYELSGTRLLREYLFAICEKSTIAPFLKSVSARSLFDHDSEDDLGYKAIDLVYPLFGTDVGTPYKIEFVKILMKNDKYRQKARDHFCATINDVTIDCDYRYKAILSLEYKSEADELPEKMNYFIREACLEFLMNDKNLPQYRILAGQNLLLTKDYPNIKVVEKVLLAFAEDKNLDYNLRADSTDVLLQLGSDEIKIVAKDIIMSLGRTTGPVTLYSNAQNVHTREIEDSVKDALEFLQSFEIMKHKGETITVEYVEGKIRKFVKKRPTEDSKDFLPKIKVAFNRIIMDRALYSKYNCTLAHILLRVWTYISSHKSENEMKKRLVEELSEMAGTCSSGFATRLVNTISGFGDFSVRISWRDQITSNFAGRLNARIRDMDDLTLQEKVLNQMTISSSKYEDRKHFLKFFRKNVSSIREELHREFKTHISETDFDLYFRSAISHYESGENT